MVAPHAEGSESSKTNENQPQSYEEFKRRKVADTTVVESVNKRTNLDRMRSSKEEKWRIP